MKLIQTALFGMMALACSAQTSPIPAIPANLNDGIKTASLNSAGINPAHINELTDKIKAGYYTNIHSLLIYKDGALVYENYFPGSDEKWGAPTGVVDHGINDLHDLRSVTKSIVSACLGIAISQGKIKSLDEKVFDYFKEYNDLDTGLKKDLTIRQLLTMSCGLKWNEDVPYNNPGNSEIQMTNSKDPVKFILSQPMVSKPGDKWNYNGGAVQLIGAIIEKTSGEKLDQYADENLFKPLGIQSYYWFKFPGSNEPAAASGLRLRSRDMLKFGMLYQNSGRWQGKQIIPASWAQESFNTAMTISPQLAYGYFFWKTTDPSYPQLTAAVGNGDQRIFFDDKNKLIVVVTAGNYNKASIFGKTNALAMLKDYVYPALGK